MTPKGYFVLTCFGLLCLITAALAVLHLAGLTGPSQGIYNS